MIGPKMKALESKVNLKLLDDIISFIVKSVTVTMLQKGEIKDRCIFPRQDTCADKFQERYAFEECMEHLLEDSCGKMAYTHLLSEIVAA